MPHLTPLLALPAPLLLLSLALPARSGEKDIVDTAVGAGSFQTLVAAVKAAGLVEALKGPGPFTVFAPSDDAFAKVPKETLDALLKPENQGRLASLLKFHVVAGAVRAKDVASTPAALTLEGQRLQFQSSEGIVRVNGAKVVRADIDCSNGVIHVIDQVLLPASDDAVATAAKAGSFGTLLAAAKGAGLAETLAKQGPFTIFAPTDAAFSKLPKETLESLLKPENKEQLAGILKLHVVSGRVYSDAAVKAGKATTLAGADLHIEARNGSVFVNGAKVTRADLDASNAVIHVIDTVIVPRKS